MLPPTCARGPRALWWSIRSASARPRGTAGLAIFPSPWPNLSKNRGAMHASRHLVAACAQGVRGAGLWRCPQAPRATRSWMNAAAPKDVCPWEVLGVKRGADAAEIKRAYLQRAKLVHPDVVGASGDAHAQFLQLAVAYAELSERPPGAEEEDEERFKKVSDPDGLRAKWYYENVSSEMHVETARQVQDAGDLEHGGPDWGGMWEMARMMKHEELREEEERRRSLEGGGRKEIGE